MKKILSLCAASIFIIGGCEKQPNLTGSIEGVQDDRFYIQTTTTSQYGSTLRIDTVDLIDQQFSRVLPDTVLSLIVLFAQNSQNGGLLEMAEDPLLLFPGDELKLSGTFPKIKAEGSDFHDQYNQFKETLVPYEQKCDSIAMLCQERLNRGESKDSIRIVLEKAITERDLKKLQAKEYFIKHNRNHLISAYLFAQLPIERRGDMYDRLGYHLKVGALKPLIETAHQKYLYNKTLKEAKSFIRKGMMAPDFQLPSTKRVESTLSEYFGKYVVLEFWASWCSNDTIRMNEYRDFYVDHKDKFQFVSVNCGDRLEYLTQKDQQAFRPWINLMNSTQQDAALLYGIDGFPSRIIIDPDGYIVSVHVGDNDSALQAFEEIVEKRNN